jgi:uncharacterized protein with NAD-binding domain and iron-sulfur cluster
MAKQKIAILGGGVGSLSTAYELTSRPGWEDRYEITVYQMGWRLGGKGASGRNGAANMHNRIEEHGLHIWMGFYENAFNTIRKVYSECSSLGLSENSTFASWDRAFSREDFTPIMENYKGQWKVWPIAWPDFPFQSPGDEALNQNAPPEVWDYVPKILNWMVERFDQTPRVPAVSAPAAGLLARIEQDAKTTAANAAATSLHAAQRFAQTLDRTDVVRHHILADLIHDFLNSFRPLAAVLEDDDHLRRLWIILETGLTVVCGLIEDDVILKGWRSIDGEDLIDWLTRHGCRHAQSPITVGLYDACFAYRDGHTLAAAAGTTLHGALRLSLTYKGAIMWHMNAGMGDTIFTPLYLLLRHRGVQFRFFHKVKNLAVENSVQTAGPGNVTAIELEVQATTRGEYDPLVQVGALKCWPSEPNWEQIVEAESIKKCVNPNLESWWTDWPGVAPLVLRRGVDFDIVVQGISIGAFPYICRELEANARWKNMVENLATVRTQGLQLWMRRTSEEMGWHQTNPEKPVLCAYIEPFDTWADMSHLIPVESWQPPDGMKSIAYFCNAAPNPANLPPFSDPTYPATQYDQVRDSARQFVAAGIAGLLPGFTANDLYDFGGDPLASQFFRVNIDPNEMYVLCVPGSAQYRLAPGDSGFGNLILAGDWTDNPINLGCVEGAVTSGMLAAQAICGKPEFIYGALGLRQAAIG